MSSLNRATLLGNVGQDPEVRRLNSGGVVVSFRLATTEKWRDRSSGDMKEKTEWHSVVIFNENLGKVAEDYVKKGSKVLVEGKIQTREWEDNDGKKRYSTEIVLNQFDAKLVLLDSRGEGGGGRGRDRDDDRRGGGSGRGGSGRDDDRRRDDDRGSGRGGGSGRGSSSSRDLDDEIPF